MTDLAEKHCTACRGGTPPMDLSEASRFLGDVPGWALEQEGRQIARGFRFRNFAQALDFVNRIGAIAEAEGHHPDLSFGWGYVRVSLHTHAIGGLHENDFIVAARINRLDGA